MGVDVWCKECQRKFTVSEFDMDTRACDICRGADPRAVGVGNAPLTVEEKDTTIEVDVWVSESWSVKSDEGYGPAEWRKMLQEVADGTADADPFIDGAMLDKEVTLTLRGPLADKLKKMAKVAV